MGRPPKLRVEPVAVLPNYKDMTRFNKELNKDKEYWKCSYCSSTSYMAESFGCDKCQPFKKGAKLIGRVYGKEQ